MQQVRGLEIGRVKVRELDVFPGSPAGTGGRWYACHNRTRRRGGRGLSGTLGRRRRQGGRSPRAQAAGARRLARVPHWRYLHTFIFIFQLRFIVSRVGILYVYGIKL